jgi:hypothetical protein
MLWGYKVMSQRFVKSFRIPSNGIDIETEIAVHALELALPRAHLEGEYRARPEGSASKLRTWRDGCLILRMIRRLLRHEHPLAFLGGLALLAFGLVGALILPVLQTYFATGLVPGLPTAVLATGVVIAGALSLTTGFDLDTVTRGRRETRLLSTKRRLRPTSSTYPEGCVLLPRNKQPELSHPVCRVTVLHIDVRRRTECAVRKILIYTIELGTLEQHRAGGLETVCLD